MDTHIDGSVLAVLATYQNNLVTSKMMTSGVVQWENTSLDGKELSNFYISFSNLRKSRLKTNKQTPNMLISSF